MVTLVKHEWHQVDSQFAFELDEEWLAAIYPDLDEAEISQKLADIESGEISAEEVINDANNNDNVEIDWERQYDDWWTDRKGGYEVTYELGDESSWHFDPKPDPPTIKCTKCKWTGDKYDTATLYLREDGSLIEDYHSTDEVSHGTKDVCPMCDSNVELTEFGIADKKRSDELKAKWEKDYKDWSPDDEDQTDPEIQATLEELKAEFDRIIVEDESKKD